MILKEILEYTKKELPAAKKKEGLGRLKEKIKVSPPVKDFASALRGKGINIIAEVKKASPSKGVFREYFDPAGIARLYEDAGASAISVLTDKKYFMGSLEDLVKVRGSVSIPVLRKDFIIDAYQVYESRAAGADAILLIVSALSETLLEELLDLSRSLGMRTLTEVRTEKEILAAISAGAEIIGVNNRDLDSFKTDISTTLRLAKKIPRDRIIVSESGITSYADITALREAGVDAFLVGEALVKDDDIAGKLRELRGG